MKKIHDMIAAAGAYLQSPALLVIRLAWGYQLFESGMGHLTHVAKTAAYFTSLNIPHPVANVYISGSTELAGGVLLMLGLFARFISIPLFFNFCVAYWTASHAEVINLLHFRNPDDFINDSAFPFLVTSLLIFAFGPGAVSFDRILLKREN
jgi:putative oxidoreductase